MSGIGRDIVELFAPWGQTVHGYFALPEDNLSAGVGTGTECVNIYINALIIVVLETLNIFLFLLFLRTLHLALLPQSTMQISHLKLLLNVAAILCTLNCCKFEQHVARITMCNSILTKWFRTNIWYIWFSHNSSKIDSILSIRYFYAIWLYLA